MDALENASDADYFGAASIRDYRAESCGLSPLTSTSEKPVAAFPGDDAM